MIDVIVPVLNNPTGIRKLLRCLSDQTLSPGEFTVNVVDNGSTDATPDVVRDRKESVDYELNLIQYNEIQTSYAARNQGIEATDAPVVAFTDSDCLPRPKWLENGLNTVRESGAGFSPGRIEVTFHNGTPNLWEHLDASLKFNQHRSAEEGWGATANLFVRRRCFENHGLFRAELTSGGDSEFGRRLTDAGESSVYASDATVEHPARASLAAIVSKETRIARGHQQLHEMGVRPDPLTWKHFVPQPWVPPLEEIDLTWTGKFTVMAGFNLVRYVYAFTRLRTRLSPEHD